MQAIPHHENEADLSHHKCFVAAMTILAAVASALHTIAVGRGIIWTDKVGTAATDGVFIYISPAFFMGLPNDFQRAFLIGHETLHIVLKHMFRGRLFRERGYFNHQLGWCHRTYNAAADYIINAMLIKMGLEMPECGLISDEFTADDVAEEVYVKLYQQPEDDEPEEGEQGDDSTTTRTAKAKTAKANPTTRVILARVLNLTTLTTLTRTTLAAVRATTRATSLIRTARVRAKARVLVTSQQVSLYRLITTVTTSILNPSMAAHLKSRKSRSAKIPLRFSVRLTRLLNRQSEKVRTLVICEVQPLRVTTRLIRSTTTGKTSLRVT
jgi:hypothetical protein